MKARWLGALMVLLCCAQMAVAADDLKGRAREVLNRNREALVSVKLVVRQRVVMMGREVSKREEKSEVSGTVIDPSGLTVVSSFMADPTARMTESLDGSNEKIKVETEVSDTALVLSDGTEIPAQFVLRDNDLDLAFVRPRDKVAKPLVAVKFAPPSAVPDVLDDVVSVGRLGRAANRECTVSIGQVKAIIKKPRTFYVVNDLLSGLFALGCPVFNSRGETVGLCVVRISSSPGSGLSSLLGAMQPVVLPAADLVEIARQAVAAPAPSPSPKP